jgi:hypothetical protein
MSWSYSPELVAEFLEANCLDTEQLQPLNMTPTPDQFYSHGKPTEHSRISRFGMTCEPLTENLGKELLTWYRAGFPVKTSALQEKAQDLTENDQDCGEKWRGWSARYDQDSCGWKTAQLSLLGDSEQSSVIFPRSGMTRDGLLWGLPMLERPTSETGFGFLLPTPTAKPMGSNTHMRSKGLTTKQVYQMWPTPTVCGNYNRKGASKTSGDGLATAVRMWPTPTAHNAKETNAPSESERNTPTLAAQAGGPLNPDWVEWLMGWPIGHTVLKPSETAKSRNAEQMHGKLLAAPLLKEAA